MRIPLSTITRFLRSKCHDREFIAGRLRGLLDLAPKLLVGQREERFLLLGQASLLGGDDFFD
jgi:hypothetical protein